MVIADHSAPRGTRPALRPGALASLALLLATACGPPNEFVPPPPPEVTVATPLRHTFVDYDHFTGRTSAREEVDIVARVEGFLLRRHFQEGDQVEVGDLLFEIDPAEYEANLAQAEAAISAAEAQRKLADATLQRLEQALESNAVSVLEVLQARADLDAAEAAIESSTARRDRAALDLEWTRVTAPLAGRVGEALVDPGNLVGPFGRSLLTTIVVYDPLYVDFDVSERDLVTKLARRADDGLGTVEDLPRVPIEVGLSNTEDFPHAGHINFVDQGVDSGTGTLRLRGEVPNPRPVKLVPGLFVRIRAPREEREALMVPESALGTDQSGRYVLVVGDDGVVEQRTVEPGPQVGRLRVIESGLEGGEQVVVNGLLRARPGGKVAAVAGTIEPPAGEGAAGAAGAGAGAGMGSGR